MDAEDMLYILYTSGTTGKAEGHRAHDRPAISSAPTRRRSGCSISRRDDVYWCTADIGWVTGHSYVVYGPLANGATVVMYEGAPDWPQKDRFWELIERHGVTIFYTAPTAIRAFMRWGTEWPEKRDLEHAAPARLGRRTDQPGSVDVVPPAHRPRALSDRRHLVADRNRDDHDHAAARHDEHQAGFGDAAVSRRRRRDPRRARQARRNRRRAADAHASRGRRCCAASTAIPIASCSRYWSRWTDGTYFTGDGARRDEDGFFWLLGRVDDVLNVAGHRLGTMEVESALVDHPKVAEAAVVGRPHEIKGQAVAAFVTVKEGVKANAGARRRAQGARRQEDRRDRPARSDSVCRRSAEDAIGKDHAPAAARHRRRQDARRYDHAGGSRRRVRG